MSGISGINSIYSMLSLGATAGAAARTVTRINKITTSDGVSQNAVDTAALERAKRLASAQNTTATRQLNSTISGYKDDLADVTAAASQLNANNAAGVFNYYDYGSTDENVAAVSAGKSLTEDKSFSLTVNTLADAKTGAKASYSITNADGSTTDYTADTNQISLPDGSGTAELRAVGTTDVYSGIDADKIVGAMQDLVSAYNKVNTNALKSSVASMASFTQAAGTKAMAAAGLSYDTNGKLQLDRGQLVKSLSSDFDGMKQTIGGTNGLASLLSQSATDTINDTIDRVSSNAYYQTESAYNRQQAQRSQDLASSLTSQTAASSTRDLFRSMYDFSKAGPYNLSNFYAVGQLFNQDV